MIRRKGAFGTLRNTSPMPWVRHVVEFGQLWGAALTVGEMRNLAGVCDQKVLWKACDKIFHGQSPWQRMMELLRSRARRRYLRGELLREEEIASKIWFGADDLHLPGFVRPRTNEPDYRSSAKGSAGMPTSGHNQSVPVADCNSNP